MWINSCHAAENRKAGAKLQKIFQIAVILLKIFALHGILYWLFNHY